MGLAGGVVAAGKHDRLDGAIELRNRDLKGHLHRVKAQVALLPLLGGLEHQRQGHHVGAVEALQRLDRLGVVLAGRAAHQGEAGEAHDPIHQGHLGVEGVVEEGIHRLGEIQAAAEHRNHGGAAVFQLLDHRHVVGLIAGHDVAALQHQADHRTLAGLLGEITAAGAPVEVLLEVFEHPRRQGMPDAQIGKHHRVGHLQLGPVRIAAWEYIFIGQHQQEVAQVVRRSPQPVLEAEHEGARILRLLHRQILEHRRQGVEQLEHGVLEPRRGAALLLALLHELGDGALALAELGH